ncbi:MAG: T9SS type A sorting domain-containing protein [bacterium]
MVNVFPNPYRGFNIDEHNNINRFVTLTHLPESTTKIQIFTLFGELIRIIEHSNGTPFERWDLRNHIGIAVASGIYIVRIDMGELGVKILKLAVFQSEERLDIF